MSKKKVNYPKKKHRITLEDVEDVSEPERRSMYHVLLDNLRTFNRATFLHRIIYVGNHKFNSYEDARNIFSINIAKCNETYCIEKLSGFFLFYYKYFVHMVEGDEDNLNKHLGYLLDNDAHYYEKLGTIKLLIHVSNINQRFFEDWIPYTEAPSKLLEKLNIDADLQQSGRYIFNCIKKLYGLMNTFAGDLFTCNDPIGEQNSSSNYDIASINSKETSLTSKTYASVSYSSHMGSLDFNLAETNQREYKLFLPEYELLDFIIHSNFTMNLKEYFGIYGVVPMRTIYKDKIWPVPHDFIPYDVFEKPYDCVTELPKDVRKKHHIDISSLSCNGFPDITDESDDVLQNYIPTLNSNNEQCRNHSLFYNEELKKFKIWAAEMFDSSGKMPSGVFYGSSHDFGNFDECLEIKVPYQDSPFVGQYCMAQFTIEPPKNLNLIHGSNYYEKSDYTKYYNDVIWEKMAVYSQDETKGSRNEFYLAFCLPSSCSPNDLKTALENNSLKINNISDFHIKVDVSNRSCQIARDIKYTIGDFLFIIFVIISVVTVIISSIYDVLIRRDTYRHLKIKGKLHNIVICCSFPRNFSKFTSKGQNLEGLDCLSGMRVYSMILIIVLHRIMFEFGSPMVNPKYVEKLYTKFETTLLLNGPILVETFFTLSGFLATYLILGQLKGSKKGVNLLLFYVHRIIRMSPTYAVILFFYCTIFIKLGTGPFWQERVGVEQERCLSSWWANLLYINNYVNTDKICMFQSWYVACDMNFFFFTPFLVWIIWKKAKLGVTIVIAFIISSILVVFVTVYMNNLDAMFMLYIKVLKDPVSHNSFKTMYIPGHMRASSYFVGILVGYIKHYMNESNMKISDKYVKIGWILCVPIMIASLYTGFVFYLLKVPPLFTALYASLYHFAWSICIAWMVIAISSGYGPWVDPILKWKPLVILARLTYCVYISHGIIQIYTAGTLRSPIYASVFNVGYQTAADVLLAYILAFLLTMMYESPIIALEKVLLRKESSLKKEADPKIEDEISTEMA